ncbi:hypothetical protein VTI74DRAFT_6512 [Chaetomium olivicolor]
MTAQVRSGFSRFADFLFDNFFLPLKASTRRTPQPRPHLIPPPRDCREAGTLRELRTVSRLFTVPASAAIAIAAS